MLLPFFLFSQQNKIYIAFLWHMHQPIYWPYESVIETENRHVYSFSLFDVFNQRVGPYTSWPKNAVMKGIAENMGHFGAQVSFSGSLIENLNNLETYGNSNFSNWKSHWNYIINQKTTLNNPRLDLVGFGYHHPLMALIDYTDIRKSIQQHKQAFAQNFPGYTYSKGIFPPENAFSVRMIPALVDEGFQWVLVDNFNFERAAQGCPTGDATGVKRPNKADILNPNPNDWIQLNGLWAPKPISAGWAHRPKYAQYVDPNTGQIKKIIVVPASRYIGNEDGRGGFGALNYEYVLSQLEPYNTDPNHPILVVLHHDGDNHGGGTESYYNTNFQNFVNWLKANPNRFECTTIQDYLDRFPPDPNDIIHVQDGSWVGADAGDPEFKKWNGDPGNYQGTPNYSPDRNSWGIITAARNIVYTANAVNPNSQYTQNAWKYYMNAMTSCYWYWDGTEMWDSHPARGANLAVSEAMNVLTGNYNDNVPPSIYLPQRVPYNPGEIEWDAVGVMPADFTVWTYVFDISGLEYVKLKYRIVQDPQLHTATSINTRTYAGGPGIGEWQEINMTENTIPSITNPQPLYKAKEYSAQITGQRDKLISYYVEAKDTKGNIAKSPIQHVWVGSGTGGGGGTNNVYWEPQNPSRNDYITIYSTQATSQSYLHWGVTVNGQNWQMPNQVYWPAGTFQVGSVVETPFTDPDNDGLYSVTLGPFNNAAQIVEKICFVIKLNDNTWDNNGGADYFIPITQSDNPVSSNFSINVVMNSTYNFSASNFAFSGASGATFNGIRVTSLPSKGLLRYNGVDVNVNQVCNNVSLLTYTPAPNEIGKPYTSFSFKVIDSQGRESDNDYTVTINVVTANPTSASSSIYILKNQSYTFTQSNFVFNSPINANFGGIKIVELPTKGTLTYQGVNVSVDQDISDVTKLTYTPLANESGLPYTTFKFRVKDNLGNYSEYSYIFTINVLDNIPNGVSWQPQNPTTNSKITIFVNNDPSMSLNSRLHWGVNNWQRPNNVYWPEGSTIWSDNVAVQSPFHQQGSVYYIELGPFNNPAQSVYKLNFVIYYGGNSWNNNGGQNWNIDITQATGIPMNEIEKTLIYPNPMQNFSIIDLSQYVGRYVIEIFDLKGKYIRRIDTYAPNKLLLRNTDFDKGVYVIKLTNYTNGEVQAAKLIVK